MQLFDRLLAKYDAKNTNNNETFDFNDASEQFGDVGDIIKNGVPQGRRSEAFQFVVSQLAAQGLTANEIEQRLREYPGGIAAKYWKRLRQEIDRSFEKWRQRQSEHGSRRTLKIFSADSLARSVPPERRWHVPNMILMSRVTLLYGNGGDGKSLLVLQLCVATAAAVDWIGKLPEQGVALILSCEDDIDEVHRRVADILAGRNDINIDDLANLHIVDLAGEDAILASPSHKGGALIPSFLFTEIERLVELYRPTMLGIDTSADVYGGDEIVRGQARQFVGFLRRLAIKYNMAVVVLGHPSLSGIASGTGTSGSTGWHNSVRGRLYLAPVKSDDGTDADPTLKQLIVMKSNYGPAKETIRLRWERGCFVLAGGDWKSTISKAEAEKVFMDLLSQFTREGRSVTSKRGPSYAPSEFANHSDSKGIGKEALRRAMDRLLKDKKIESVETGPPSRRRSKLVIVIQ